MPAGHDVDDAGRRRGARIPRASRAVGTWTSTSTTIRRPSGRVGDLDGAGRAEIVAYASDGGLVAFRYDAASDSWPRHWHTTCADGSLYAVTGGGCAGPSIHDLDDDGVPEVLRGGVVFGADGVLRGGALGYLDFVGTEIFPVCRARHPQGAWGVRVYSDHADRWVDSRRIWNQHAYSVTHIEEDGTVPATSDVAPNWLEPGLNDFRANVQGSNDPLASPDLTVVGRYVCDDDALPVLFAQIGKPRDRARRRGRGRGVPGRGHGRVHGSVEGLWGEGLCVALPSLTSFAVSSAGGEHRRAPARSPRGIGPLRLERAR